LNINPTVRVEKVAYDDGAPWVLPPDGTGPSLERLNRATYANEPANWTSRNFLGSPGGPSQIDADADGVPDNWEYAVFQTTANNDFLTADRDSDGRKDAAEFLAGTNPLVADAGLSITLARQPASMVRLTYPTILAPVSPGYYGRARTYTVSSSPTLVSPTWDTVSGLGAVPATGTTVQHDLSTPVPASFFRVQINLP
jgi:hypothetical protein